MLSLSSIQSVAPPPMARPSLVVDAARTSSQPSPLQVVEPATAVSKERARVENKLPEPGVSVQVSAAAWVAGQTQAADANKVQRAKSEPKPAADNQPPTEKSPIQKALDVQIKGLLTSVWKASGKAVDFLLGREAVEQAEQASQAALEFQSDIWPAIKSDNNALTRSALTQTKNENPLGTFAYTPRGEADSGKVDQRGQLLDYVA